MLVALNIPLYKGPWWQQQERPSQDWFWLHDQPWFSISQWSARICDTLLGNLDNLASSCLQLSSSLPSLIPCMWKLPVAGGKGHVPRPLSPGSLACLSRQEALGLFPLLGSSLQSPLLLARQSWVLTRLMWGLSVPGKLTISVKIGVLMTFFFFFGIILSVSFCFSSRKKHLLNLNQLF